MKIKSLGINIDIDLVDKVKLYIVEPKRFLFWKRLGQIELRFLDKEYNSVYIYKLNDIKKRGRSIFSL